VSLFWKTPPKLKSKYLDPVGYDHAFIAVVNSLPDGPITIQFMYSVVKRLNAYSR
jgi:hypothetical protein